MPRSYKRVKNKPATRGIVTPGLIDLHFHGAYGIDLMRAAPSELDELTWKLSADGLAGFCATTLSVHGPELSEAVGRLGAWIEKTHRSAMSDSEFAIPLGIHLEGPFISSQAAGAHPPGVIRPLRMEELEVLWEKSRGTLKVLTVAPEALSELGTSGPKRLANWCSERSVHLSLGHTPTDEASAERAFEAGFTGVTHAWNALSFHHRSPGALGAALGRKGLFVELIPDGIHVHPTVMRWTHRLHYPEPVCWVSDGAPAAGLGPDQLASFGPLEIQNRDGACRLRNGSLAGGGRLLPECVSAWIEYETARTRASPRSVLREVLPFVTRNPLRALQIGESSSLGRAVAKRKVRWGLGRDGIPRVGV